MMQINVRPLKCRVLVTELEFGVVKTAGGLILQDDDGKSSGIKPRWAKVYKVGEDVTDVQIGDYVLIKHGRWTRGVNIDTITDGKIKVNMIDFPDAVLIVSKERPKVLDQLSKSL